MKQAVSWAPRTAKATGTPPLNSSRKNSQSLVVAFHPLRRLTIASLSCTSTTVPTGKAPPVGELAAALRGHESTEHTAAEFADVLAWLATLANIAGVDLDEAVRRKYGAGCPECRRTPCACGAAEKP